MSTRLPGDPMADRPQFAQLIYTSYDDGSSAGGWRVKAETGGLNSAERQALTSRIVTRFDVGDPLPAYPTPDEIARRPARLAYTPLPDEAAGYWHTVDAGTDGTGRPGNVMAHVVLDRNVTTPSSLRPIQLWGSRNWLRPFGAAEVAAATLTDADMPAPTTDTSVASIVGFLTGAAVDRQSVFRVLLDAVYAAMSGGPGIVLATHDLSIGAKWIAAVSYLMSPGTARRFSWCTHDDPKLAVTDLRRGTNLVIVAADVADQVAGGQWVLIDDAEEPGIGELGSTHRTSGGDVTVTGWSVLAEGVLESAQTATRLIAAQDAVAAAVGDRGLSPAWPLAVAVRSDPELSEYHSDANHLVADDQPAHSDAAPWVAEVVEEAVAATAGATAEDSLIGLIRAHGRGIGVAGAARRLLQTALADQPWLARGPVAEVPSVNLVDVEPFTTLVDDAVADLSEGRQGDSCPSVLPKAIRVDELLRRLCVDGPELQRVVAPLHAQIARSIGDLTDVAVVRTLRADAAITIASRERLLRPAVAQLPPSALFAMEAESWAWLFGDDYPKPVIPANPDPHDHIPMAHYIRATFAREDRVAVDADAIRLAADGAFMALDAADLGDDDCRRLVDAIASASRIDPADLAVMYARWPDRISTGAAVASIYYQPVPAELVTLIATRAERETDTTMDRAARTGARLRALRYVPPPWTSEHLQFALADAHLAYTEYLSADHIADLADDVAEVVGTAFVIAQIRGEQWADARTKRARALAQRLRHRSAALTETLVGLTTAGLLDVGWFVGYALLQRIEGLDTPSLLPDDGGRPQLVDAVVTGLLERQGYSGATDIAGLRDYGWIHVRAMDAAQAERYFGGYARAARDWLQDNRIGGEHGLRGFLRSNF